MENTVKTNQLATASFICGLIALVSSGAVYSLLYFPRSIYLLSAELSLIIGILALNEIKIAGGIKKGRTFARIGIILGMGVLLFRRRIGR